MNIFTYTIFAFFLIISRHGFGQQTDPEWNNLYHTMKAHLDSTNTDTARYIASSLVNYSRDKYGESHPYYAYSLNNLGCLTIAVNVKEAEQYILESLEVLMSIDTGSVEVAIANANLGKAKNGVFSGSATTIVPYTQAHELLRG